MIRIVPLQICGSLCLIAIGLIAGHIVTQVGKYGYGHDYQYGLVRLLDLHQEANLPTWFSSTLMLICAALLFLIAAVEKAQRDRFARYWGALGAVFVVLSIDEAAGVHEDIAIPLREAFHASGLLYYTWVIPAMLFLVVLSIVYARFLLAVPRLSGALFVLSGSLYVLGAVGMEMLSGAEHFAGGTRETLRYAVLAGMEESLEMLALALFAYALSRHLARRSPDVRLSFAADVQGSTTVAMAEPICVRHLARSIPGRRSERLVLKATLRRPERILCQVCTRKLTKPFCAMSCVSITNRTSISWNPRCTTC
jgi:hypothetical protein